MFSTSKARDGVLAPEAYWTEDTYEVEVERIFLPRWLPVATVDDLPSRGDFLTTRLLGEPLLLRNDGEQIRAFRNVCCHRRCLLRSESSGRQERLRCQYHGWVYEEGGGLDEVPEAWSFEPLPLEKARLHAFECDTVARVVFVRLRPGGPGLRESLGSTADVLDERLGGAIRQFHRRDYEFAGNWKIVLENQIEDLHVSWVHSRSFGFTPPADWVRTRLEPERTEFDVRAPAGVRAPVGARLAARFMEGIWGGAADAHQVVDHFPSLHVLWEGDRWPGTTVTWVHPLSPRKTLQSVRGFFRDPEQMTFLQRRIWPAVKRTWVRVSTQVLDEDSSLYAATQEGLENSEHPGVLGIREERVAVLREFVKSSLEHPVDVAQATPVPAGED